MADSEQMFTGRPVSQEGIEGPRGATVSKELYEWAMSEVSKADPALKPSLWQKIKHWLFG
jgi:hypothetical protein